MPHIFDDSCINHNCDTCKYRDIVLPGLPCRKCIGSDNQCYWEPTEEEAPQ
jgi:hypothetical protein